MNIISSKDGQGVYMIPKENISGISYSDYYYYNAEGQLWLFGGASDDASPCGLAFAKSNAAWTSSSSYHSARLAFYGALNKVSSTQFKALGV